MLDLSRARSSRASQEEGTIWKDCSHAHIQYKGEGRVDGFAISLTKGGLLLTMKVLDLDCG